MNLKTESVSSNQRRNLILLVRMRVGTIGRLLPVLSDRLVGRTSCGPLAKFGCATSFFQRASDELSVRHNRTSRQRAVLTCSSGKLLALNSGASAEITAETRNATATNSGPQRSNLRHRVIGEAGRAGKSATYRHRWRRRCRLNSGHPIG